MLDETSVLGVTTNRGFLSWLAANQDVRAGTMWTTLIDERWPEIAAAADEIPHEAWSAAASALGQQAVGATAAPPPGFRLNAAARIRVAIGAEARAVDVPAARTRVPWISTPDGSVLLDVDGRSVRAALAPPPTVEAAVRSASHEGGTAAAITAPMPGTVIYVRVSEGDEVEAGQVLVVLEAMKMENTVPAPAAGRVARVLVTPGQQVQRGEVLVELV